MFLGIDIGGTSFKAGLVDRNGRVSRPERRETPATGSNEIFTGVLLDLISVYLDSGLKGIGIGAVGPLDREKGIIFHSANIPGIRDCPVLSPVRSLLKEKNIDIPVQMHNDASVTALSQFHFGIGRGVKNLATVTLGTGIGGGLLLDGRLYDGHLGNAFEIGHTMLTDEFWSGGLPVRRCGCGSPGCLETIASATGVAGYHEIFSGEKLTTAVIADRARQGDKIALRVFDLAGRALGAMAVNLIHTLNLPLIIITGGLAACSDLLNPALQRTLEERLFPVFRSFCRVEFTAGDENYGIMGAACLCF